MPATAALTTPQGIAELITADTHADYTATFEMIECRRCGGSGYYGPMSINGGRCFKCGGATKHRTKRGQEAYETFTALMDELMGVGVMEIAVGDRVYLGNRWRTITEVKHRDTHGKMTIGRETTEWFREAVLSYASKTESGYVMADHFRVRRYSGEARAEVLRRMCAVRGATVFRKETAAA